MKLKIIKYNQYKDKDGNPYFYYKFYLNKNIIWISTLDFKNQTDLLLIENDNKNLTKEDKQKTPSIIILKEPIDEFYQLTVKKNKNVEFLVLKPKKQNVTSEISLKEPAVIYKTKENRITQIQRLFSVNLQIEDKTNDKKREKLPEKAEINTDKVNEKLLFIDNLLNYAVKKKVDKTTRERLFTLIGKEVGNSGLSKKEIEQIIDEKLKQGLKQELKEKDIDNENEKKKRKLEHDPKRVVELLKQFTNNNSDLKWTTHIWDDLSKFETINVFFNLLDKNLKAFYQLQFLNSDLYWKKVYPFVFQKKIHRNKKTGEEIPFEWGQYKIKIGWQYPDTIKKWSEQNYDNKLGEEKRLPFEMKLPKELIPKQRINGKTVLYFEQVVDIFKNEIEFRENDLYFKIKRIIKVELNEFKIKNIESLKGWSFFTNTEMVLKALKRIFGMIKKRTIFPEVEFNIISKNDTISIEILHYDSFSEKQINHSKIMLNEKSGDMTIIRDNLFSLCDFSVISKFKKENNDYYAHIHYLYNGIDSDNLQPNIIELSENEVKGFKYILTFPL